MENLQPNSALGIASQFDATESVKVPGLLMRPSHLFYEMVTDTTKARVALVFLSQPKTETEFERQERLFYTIPQTSLDQYQGEFVASVDGQIVDHDLDFPTLTERFFNSFGDEADVYMAKIGEDNPIIVTTPLR